MVAIKTNTQDTIQSPFGMVMPGRNWTAATATGYGFGFNGKLKDDDIMGSSNSYDFGARIYDARIAKWLSCDPAQCEYPHTSTYAFALNNPLIFLDPDGKRVYYAGGASFKPDKNYRQENFIKKLKEEFLKVMKKQLKLFLLGKFNSLNSLSIQPLIKFFKVMLDILLKSWQMINPTGALPILKLILKRYLFYNLDLNPK